MGRAAVILCLVVCLLGLVPAASAAEHRRLVVGTENQDYRPYYWTDQQGFHSAVREILDAFAKSRGLEFAYRSLPVNRLYQGLFNGDIDLKFPDSPLWKPQEKTGHQIIYSRPIMSFVDGVMVLPNRKGMGIGGLKVLGTMLGFTPWDYLPMIKTGKLRLLENGSLEGLLEQVILGRVDGAYVNPLVAGYQLANVLKKPGALVYDPGLPHTTGDYLVSSIRHPDIIAELDRFMSEQAEAVTEIRGRYGVPVTGR